MTQPYEYQTAVKQVGAIWSEMLNRPGVAVDAQFVDLGGDSLLLLSILTEVEDTFGVELDTEAVVQDLTVAGMTRLVVAWPGT